MGAQGTSYLLSISIIEIYQEKLADLLTDGPDAAWNRTAAQNAGLEVKLTPTGGYTVPGATKIVLRDINDALRLLQVSLTP